MVFGPDGNGGGLGEPANSFITVLVEHSFYQDSIHESR